MRRRQRSSPQARGPSDQAQGRAGADVDPVPRPHPLRDVLFSFIILGMTQIAPDTPLPTLPARAPGQLLARGVCRALSAAHDFACLEEVTLATGLRVDVMALGPKGEIWVVECKSSRADFTADAKWQGYLDWADRFFWAVGPDFPTDLLPPETGLILADPFGAEIVRTGPEAKLAGARRKALTLRFARIAARRAMLARDPEGGQWGAFG